MGIQKIVSRVFNSEDLNVLATRLLELDNEFYENSKVVEKALYSAFKSRWEYGKLIYENYDKIIEECGSQKNFAEAIGKTEAYVSNNKRGYVFLLNEGAKTWEDVYSILENKRIRPIVSNFEKIGTLLNEPTPKTHYLTQQEKDEKRLLELREEAEEILRRTEPLSNRVIYNEAFEVIEDLDVISEYLKNFNPEKVQWESEKYLNHVRRFGKCLVTGVPAEQLDAHHTTPWGGVGPMGGKLPDYYAIPVLREIHIQIEEGRRIVAPEDILMAQFICLSSFLKLNMK